MVNKFKYMRRVFSGKEVPVTGMDQGRSPLYRGQTVQQIWNAVYDGSMTARDGELDVATYDEGINSGFRLRTKAVVCSGSDVFVGD